jgi:hypothetical protein
MTTVEITFRYQGEVRPESLSRIRDEHSNFGVRKVQTDAGRKSITVEYDATRLDASGVTSVLRRVGIAVVPIEQAAATGPRP